MYYIMPTAGALIWSGEGGIIGDPKGWTGVLEFRLPGVPGAELRRWELGRRGLGLGLGGISETSIPTCRSRGG